MRFISVVPLACAIVLCVPACASEDVLDATLVAELDRLDALLTKAEAAGLPADFAGVIKPNREILANVRATKSPLLKLYRLRDGFIGVETIAFVAEHKTTDINAFVKLWNARKPRFDAKAQAPAGVRLQTALAQAATNRAAKLFRASLPYGKASGPMSGVYYLGEAEANFAFRAFLDRLKVDGEDATMRPTHAMLTNAADMLEDEMLNVFAADPGSNNMVAVSVRLKEVRELLDQQQLDGATLMLLETRLALSRRAPKPAVTLTPSTASATNDTLIRVFDASARESDGETPALIRTSVFPLYAALARSKP
ncbi:MAG TPA: hypothetical protein VF698_07380 [Thermoanaerobaculia bacterium]|jgi:TusA-related sulfurtransferase